MKVLLVGGTSAALGGVERYCQRFADAFALHSEVGVRVLPAESAVAGAPPGAYARRLLSSLARVRRDAAALDPRHDAVWVQYGNAPDLLLVVAVRAVFRGRLLVTVHAGEQWRHLRSGRVRRAAAWALRRADAVCALSGAQRALWAGEGIRAEVVPTLLPDWVNRGGDAAGPRQGVLFVGRLSPEKGVGDLLEAFARAAPGERLHVAGTGDPAYAASLRERARALGLGDRVEWHGVVPEQGVSRLMARCRLFVYPSSADAYPLSVLEAFAAGMRVVAYDIPGTAEMLAEYGGAAVRPGDVAALADEMERALGAGEPDRAGAAALRRRLGWAAVVRRYEAVLGRGAIEAPRGWERGMPPPHVCADDQQRKVEA